MAGHASDELRVPLVEEQLEIATREVESDRVRVRTVVDVHEEPIEAVLQQGVLAVERVAVDREVDEAPAPYQDGDTLVIPVVEERLVVQKRLFVVEELRVTRTSRDEAVRTTVPLRRTRAIVERDDTPFSTKGND